MRFVAPLAATAVFAIVTAPLAAEKITDKENDLLAAGFASRVADTPQRAAMLARLPNKRFVRHAHPGGQTSYVYADVKNCNCLYVGSEAAYGQYRRHRDAKTIASEREMAAMDYRDAAWDWGAWGSFGGGPWGGIGFHRRGW